MKKVILVIVLLIIGGGLVWWGTSGSGDGEQAATTTDQDAGMALETTASDVSYYDEVTGYLAEPAEEGMYPGVVMIHEWWGLNDHIKNQAEELAREGYRVLAVDLYNGEVATTSARAGELSSSINQGEALANMQAATAYLRDTGSERVAGLGWCFGGGQELQLAIADSDLDAHVIYYGSSLATSTDALASVSAPVLGIFGADDQVTPVEQVNEFEQSLTELGVENQIHIYDGVGHAFANPSNDDGYAPEEADDAWMKTLEFLRDTL